MVARHSKYIEIADIITDILRRIPMGITSAKKILLPLRRPPSMQKRVTSSHHDGPHGVTHIQTGYPGLIHGCNKKTKSGDRDGKWVLVHAVNALQTPTNQVPVRSVRLSVAPLAEQATERSKEEVTRPTGRVDQPKTFTLGLIDSITVQPKLLNRWLKGVIKNKLLHKLRGLQERICLSGFLGQVLVQVTEEAGVPLGISEVVDQVAVITHRAPEVDEDLGRLVRRSDRPHRVVLLVKEPSHHRGHAHLLEGVL